jgi:hypothetical protein
MEVTPEREPEKKYIFTMTKQEALDIAEILNSVTPDQLLEMFGLHSEEEPVFQRVNQASFSFTMAVQKMKAGIFGR